MTTSLVNNEGLSPGFVFLLIAVAFLVWLCRG